MKTLGIAGLVSHPKEVTEKYNKLLEQIGTEGMLIQFERFMDTEEFIDLIIQIEDNLLENGINPKLD
jgi:hypothetical protein